MSDIHCSVRSQTAPKGNRELTSSGSDELRQQQTQSSKLEANLNLDESSAVAESIRAVQVSVPRPRGPCPTLEPSLTTIFTIHCICGWFLCCRECKLRDSFRFKFTECDLFVCVKQGRFISSAMDWGINFTACQTEPTTTTIKMV